jgi:hypothetical protein
VTNLDDLNALVACKVASLLVKSASVAISVRQVDEATVAFSIELVATFHVHAVIAMFIVSKRSLKRLYNGRL